MYWVLEQDLSIPASAAVVDVPEKIDIMKWMKGQIVTSPAKDLSLMLRSGSGDYRGDIIGGVVTLFSEELIQILNKFGVDNIQYFPVELVDPLCKETEYGYFLVNVVGLPACVEGDYGELPAWEKPSSLEKFTIDHRRAKDFSIFRIKEAPRLIVINDKLHEFLQKEKVVGVRMRKTVEYTVW